MKESRKKFIIEAHKHACSDWKYMIEFEFPKLFKETELEVGKWYKTIIATFYVTELNPLKSYGFYSGVWEKERKTAVINKIKPATDKEVETVLIKEAKKRGFKEGAKVKCLEDGKRCTVKEMGFEFESRGNLLWVKQVELGNWLLLLKDGKWATITDTITKEQAEKELGKTIIN